MELEDYFEFEPSGRILVRGTGLGVECLLLPWLEGTYTTDILRQYHPRVTLEQISATITYYLHERGCMDAYLDRVRQQSAPVSGNRPTQDFLTPAHIRALRAHGLRGYLQTLEQGPTKA